MRISIIVGVGKNREIGKNNQLLCRVSEDLKNFKMLTMGHHIVMGRKTFESIGKPLPGRTTLILSRDKNYRVPQCKVVGELGEALGLALQKDEHELFIIGGAEIYKLALPFCQRLYLSCFDLEAKDADAFFPAWKSPEWQLIVEKRHAEIPGKSPAWTYQIWDKEAQPSN